jgi:hypothetical protein
MSFQSYADVAAALKAESDVWSQGQGHTDAAVRQRALDARAWWENYQAPSPAQPSSAAPPPQPTPPTNPWNRTNNFVDLRGVKQPDPSVILFDSGTIAPEYLIELEYEDISGMELINMSRSDLIDGQSVIYSPIKNLSYLRTKYNPNNIIAIPSYTSSEFSKYRIDLILRGIGLPYFDEEGNLVIEIEDVRQDELVEVQIDSSGTINLVDFS